MIEYNKYFSIEDHIGEVLSESEFQCLLADKKLYTTTCRMTGVDASKAMGKHVSNFAVEERTYGGLIVANSHQEAAQIAEERGFGETVEGVLYGVIPYNHRMINPTDTSNNKN